ncbi:S41 family peptidase [Hymenobacter cheonanensis]|uniref:S41 family peptidase n=1 Tax=Hymenobacter sp. CA2-7 TaxID=3063993 RepID=UPI0027133397|nr:S41 family peptidase [Hymenobacter sp. CA2-7]MDO7884988.1 S41 family peptidase [Hymenobacter sp. CA2-7]
MPAPLPSPSDAPAAARAPARRGWGYRLALLPALTLGIGIILGTNPFRPRTENPDATARGYLRYKEILSYIDRDYVDSVDADGLTNYAVAQLLGKLDPHSVYIPAKDREQVDAFLQSSFDGVGLDFNFFRDTATVVATLPGGPAEAAGLLPGDQLLRVGTQPVAGTGLSITQLTQLLRGPRGSSLSLTVARPQQPQPLAVRLNRGRLPNTSVEPGVLLEDGQTGYIKVNRFAANTYEEFKAQLADLQRQGLKRLVLDLRGNPGGYLDRATRLADEFIAGSRKIVYTAGKDEQYATQTYAHVAGDWEQNPLVVLVDENSASAAEVLAGALQDHDRALLVGRRTFGKGLVQQPIALQEGGELRLTVARYYTPVGRCIQKPYGPDRATYQREVAERQQHGELASADSVHFAAGQQFRTDHGRVVYGGGGIMPDVFVARDTLLHSAYYLRLQNLGVVRAYALAFYQQHKAELAGLRFAQYQAVFRVTDTELDGLTRLAAQAGVRPNPGALRRSAPALRNCLKAYIARSAYGPEASRAVLRDNDLELQQALHVVQDSTAQLALLGGK